jgi:hypothetical protein
VVTKLPEAGAVLQMGDVLMETEGNPVILIHGDVPLWRQLVPGTSGIDVAMVRGALAELGYDVGDQASQVYDVTLAAALDQLYVTAGYPTPSSRADAQANLKEKQDALAAAETEVTTAQEALRDAQAGPTQAQLTAANNEIAAAQRDLTAAQQAFSAGTGDAVEVSLAQAALDLAKANLADLQKTKDTTAEQAALTQAQAVRDKAQQEVTDAQVTSVGPKDLLAVTTTTLRVDTVSASLGMDSAGQVITWTDTMMFARAELTDSQRLMIATGSEVTVTLPDGMEVPGVVEEVTASHVDEYDMWTTIPAEVRVALEDQGLLEQYGVCGVTIRLVQGEAADVLVVPVTALVALSEGGYAVQKENGELIGVDVGLIADTRAEITVTYGDLEEGDVVVVA